MLLSAGQAHAPLRHDGIVAVFQRGDEFIGLGDAGRIYDLFIGSVGIPPGDVLFDRGTEQFAFLQGDGNLVPQFADFIAAHVHTVDADTAFRCVVKAGDEVDQRSFAAAGGPHDGDGFAGFDNEIDMFQDRFLAAGIGEGNVTEFDFAFCRSRSGASAAITGFSVFCRFRTLFRCFAIRPVPDLRFQMQDRCQPFPGNEAPGNILEQHQQHHDAHQQLGGVGDGRHDAARGGSACHHVPGPVPEDRRDGQVHKHIDDRTHKREDQQYPQLGADQIVVSLAEAQFFIGFPYAGLDDADGGNVFLQHIVHVVQFFLQGGEQRIHLAQAESHGADDEGQGNQYDEGEIRAEGVHEIHAADGHQNRTHHAPDTLGDQPFHLGHIVGDAGDERTGAETVDLGKGKGHDLPEGVFAQIVAEILACHVYEHVVERAEAAADQHHADHLGAQPPDQFQIAYASVVQAQHAVIHDAAHKARLDQVHQNLAAHEQGRDDCVVCVFANVLPHTVFPQII